MSIKRLNEFPDGSGSLTADDVFLFMDDPSGGGVTKKISLSQISSAIGGGGSGAELNDLTSVVTWANVPDANITESSVVQHSGALRLTESQIVDLGSYIASGENVSLLVNDSDYIASNTNIATGSDKVTNIVSLSQAEYDAITPSTGVLYFIDDAPAPATSGDNISQFTNDAGYLTAETNDLTSTVTWANVPDANITESSVVQHSGSLRLTESQIVDLGNYLASGDNVSKLSNDAGYIISDNSVASGSDLVTNVISLTQEEYDLITPESGIVYLISGGSTAITSETNDLTSAVTWANVPDANITESSVIQHSGALRLTESQIVDLGDYVASGDNVSLLVNDSNYVASGDNISLLTNDSLYVASDVTGITGASGVSNIVQISQADYDALGTYDQNTIYFIV